jgi:predicted enzyme related to lactoylglutathione lyase
MHGQFTWYELTTPDVDAAQAFYPRITGWKTQRFDDDYTMWTTGGVPLAGLFRLGAEMRERGIPPNWMPYVESDDVDATARLATSLGGAVMHGPVDVTGAGRVAVIQDPQGAVCGVYRAATPAWAWDGTPVVGRVSWHELMTGDHVRAASFYGALFGWEKVGEMDMGGGAMYHMFGKGGQMYGAMYDTPAEMAGMHPFWLCYIHVKDVPRAVAAATRAGAIVHRDPMDIPGGSIAILGDPQGAGFAVHASAALPAARPAARPARNAARRKAPKRASSRPGGAAARKAATVAKKAMARVAPGVKRGARVVKKTSARARAALKVRARASAKAASKVRDWVKSKAKVVAKAGSRATKKSRVGGWVRSKAKTIAKARSRPGVKPRASGRAKASVKPTPKARAKAGAARRKAAATKRGSGRKVAPRRRR